MNLRKILIKTGLHTDIIDIIENLYIKEIKKEMFEEMNILFSHSHSLYNENRIHMIHNDMRTTIYYPKYIKTFYKSKIFGRWTEVEKNYNDLKKVKCHYVDCTKQRQYYFH